MLKSFVNDMAKDQLLSKSAFNPVNFFRDLTKASGSFLKDIEIEEEEIEIQMIYKFESKPNTWILTNKSKVLGIKDHRYVELPIHSVRPDEKLTIYRLEQNVCDKFYLFSIDRKVRDTEMSSTLEQRIIELNKNTDSEVIKIELQSYLDHEITNHQIDKLTLLEIVL